LDAANEQMFDVPTPLDTLTTMIVSASILLLLLVLSHAVSIIALDAAKQRLIDETRAFRSKNKDASFDDLAKLFSPPKFQPLGVISDFNSVKYSECFDLNAQEREILLRDSVMTSERHVHKTFFDAYLSIFKNHLPVYITADAVLHPLHRSYDNMLKSIEVSELTGALQTGLATIHARLRDAYANVASMNDVRADLDVYLAVARHLLSGERSPSPLGSLMVAGGSASDALAIVVAAMAAAGPAAVPLFGAQPDAKTLDFSTFKPRGHYVSTSNLEAYFRALMWIGRLEFRLAPLASDAVALIDRETVAALLLAELSHNVTELKRVDSVLTTIVGESDNAKSGDLVELMHSSGIANAGDAVAKPELLQAFRDKLLASDVGVQRILGQLLAFPQDESDIKIPRSFLLLGQRFTFDSGALSSLVSQNASENPLRLMPNEKDIVYAVLGNDVVLENLESDASKFKPYAGRLAAARHLIEQTPASVWTNSSLYNAWLNALRNLSPPTEAAEFGKLPKRAQTAAYWRSKANSQLTSFAELRRNNILLVKESFSGGVIGCEYPAVYVEPIPKFWRAVADYASVGLRATSLLSGPSSVAKVHFQRLLDVATRLESMATKHVSGVAVSNDDLIWANTMAFIKIVQEKTGGGCGDGPERLVDKERLMGWLYDLYMDSDDVQDVDRVVSSIHTQPTDEEGSPVGRVLHFGTDSVETTLVLADDCSGDETIVFVGATQSFKSLVTSNFVRLTDEEWEKSEVTKASRPDFLKSQYAAGANAGALWEKKCDSNPYINPGDSGVELLALCGWTVLLGLLTLL
jgi:hypothetical protein